MYRLAMSGADERLAAALTILANVWLKADLYRTSICFEQMAARLRY
jgi:hypothetical protein